MQRAHADIYTAGLDAKTDQLAGKTLRLYTGNPAATFGSAPAGTLLAEMVIPNPSHGPAAWNAAVGAYEALLSGSYQDLAANAGGTIGCFAVFNGATLIWDGTAGTSGKDMTVSQATVTVGAPFSITKWTLRQPPMS